MKRMACGLLPVIAVVAVAIIGGCKSKSTAVKTDGAVGAAATSAYDHETDWNDAANAIPLGYQEAQGKRIFYQYCVWCHADATPAGPSNRSNLTPVPPLLNDGDRLNGETDEFLQSIITVGGSGVKRSPMMPPYGKTLTADQIRAVIAFTRSVAQPPYLSKQVVASATPATK
jgi:mono/diheme cytochrome c family protein